MAELDLDKLTALLQAAEESPLGKKVKSADADALRRRLYVVRRRIQESTAPKNSRFSGLVLRLSPSDKDTLFIIKEIKEDSPDAES